MHQYGGGGRGVGRGGFGGGNGRRGLQEPLLLQNNNRSTNQNRDVENGTSTSQSSNTEVDNEGGPPVPPLQQKYRLSTFLVAAMGLFTTLFISWNLKNETKGMFFDSHGRYTLSGSVCDLVWVRLFTSLLIMIQSSRTTSLKLTKIAGYSSLLSLLFVITKICCVAGQWEHETDSDEDEENGMDKLYVFALLLALSVIICIMECILEFLVGTFSSKDFSTTVAPTAAEAAEGIVADEAKTIGLWSLMKVLRPYFWPDGSLNRVCVFMTWVFLILSKASNVIAPLYISKATDDLASSKEGKMGSITKDVIIYALLLLSNKALKEAQALSYIRVKLTAGVQLKEEVFAHLLALSMDWHQRKSMGAVVTAMQRGIMASNLVVQYIFLYLFPTFIEAIVVAVVFVEAFGAPLLAAVAICGCTLYIAVTVEMTIYRMQFRKKMNKADNDAYNTLTDTLLNIETVKCFTAEKYELQRYKDNVETFRDQAGKIQGSLSLLNTSQQVVLNGTLVAALLVAAQEYAKGDFTVGQFVAVNVYVMQLFAPLNFLGSIYSMAVGSYVDLQNLCNMLAEKPDIEDRDGAETLAVEPNNPLEIEFRNVVFSYPSRREVEVLKGISFIVPPGSTTAVVGETGSGKSTLTRLLFRFYEADQGQVLVGGKDVLTLTQTSLRKNLGLVPQDSTLFNDTLEYNIRYGARDSEEDAVTKAASAAELDDFISNLPEGLNTVVGERGQQVSGGQKQRIAIARVLMKDCPIVVLDEATSSLDSRTEQQIQKALECLRGRTMFVIAHRLSTIQNADQIIVMANGEILERGSHDELLEKGHWHERCYASLWEKQKKAD